MGALIFCIFFKNFSNGLSLKPFTQDVVSYMLKVKINNKEISVPKGATIIQACEIADVEIPRFCYHERLAIAGNCRMCLVEVAGGPPKPVASCAMPAADGMEVFTDTPMVKKARQGATEFLLANHPLDCPICDQGGECDLQDQAYQYGRGESEYEEQKRSVKDKNMGPLIKTHMTRCIHCTRCVRFMEDVAGTTEMGAINRGESMEITTFLEKSITSELSGNIIDLCPVGALTSKPYAFKARSWELKKTESIDVMDGVGSNIRIDSRGVEVMRILPSLNEDINEEWISDKTRFCYDGLKYQRLDKPYIRKNNKLQEVNFEDAYSEVVKTIKSFKPDEIAGFTGNVSAVEEISALKILLEKLDVKNFDCRLKNEKIDSSDRTSYLFNSTIAGIEDADACLLIGVNPRKDASILNARIRKRFLSKELKIASIGCNADLTYDYHYLGDEVESLKAILDGSSEFCQTLSNSKNPMLILGQDMVARKDGKEIVNLAKQIAEKFNMIQNDWNGFNFLSKSTGLINGLEVGFTNKSTSEEIFNQIDSNAIKMVILHSVDDDIDLGKLKDTFVVYIGSHGDQSAQIADVILPAAAYSEKDATYINVEGRSQKASQAISAPGQAKQDWLIIKELADKLDIDLGFKSLSELRNLIYSQNPTLMQLDIITQSEWIKSNDSSDLLEEKLFIKPFDFYLTNPITRASRTLNKCSDELS